MLWSSFVPYPRRPLRGSPSPAPHPGGFSFCSGWLSVKIFDWLLLGEVSILAAVMVIAGPGGLQGHTVSSDDRPPPGKTSQTGDPTVSGCWQHRGLPKDWVITFSSNGGTR
jgi:hypothetical protein